MTFEQAEEYVERTKKYGSILGLESIRNLMHHLKDVQEELPIIHVAGTNGKGSVCAFLASALEEGGYRVGRFNSPAVFERREVFQINGQMISKDDYAKVIGEVAAACEKMTLKGEPHPTVFEVETAAAFLWFYEQKCDLVLLETGMGGETDATNLITKPLCSVLTSIDLDHMQYLGDTLSEIAKVKAGIIKKGCPVIALKQAEEVNTVIADRAGQMGAEAVFADASECILEMLTTEELKLCHPYYGTVSTKLAGAYQKENLTLALEVLRMMEKLGFSIEKETVRKGIAKTIWEGRFEVIGKEPLFIIDGAHNPAAVRRLEETIEKDFTNRKIIYIIGVLADKEHMRMMGELLSKAKKVYTVTPDNPRALDGRVLEKEVRRYTRNTEFAPQIKEAVKGALQEAKKDDVILAFGSLSYLGEVKRALLEIEASGKHR